MKNIRNFCIIAHIDHGKSTLADRLLQSTGTISDRDMMDQVLDDMDLEREKGITIKSHAIQINYKHKDGKEYILNLIDTPGHVDFSYEVSRALAACEGCLLLVDATQGIQAQTISNLYLAIENDLEIIPIINKIDMDGAMVDEVRDQIVDLVGCKPETILLASARTGLGVPEIIDAIVERIPAPEGDPGAFARRALDLLEHDVGIVSVWVNGALQQAWFEALGQIVANQAVACQNVARLPASTS